MTNTHMTKRAAGKTLFLTPSSDLTYFHNSLCTLVMGTDGVLVDPLVLDM